MSARVNMRASVVLLLVFGCAARLHHSLSCEIFCYGEILHAVETARVFNDSKTFVDLPLKVSPAELTQRFRDLEEHTLKSLRNFLSENFGDAGSDMIEWTPADWHPQNANLNEVDNQTIAEFAYAVHNLWPVMGKRVGDIEHEDRHSLLKFPHGAIVPGGRFRDIYYWDSFWIIKGLLVSNMTETAQGMIRNLLHFVSKYGFVPNGSRAYYLNRSQPPMLAAMVAAYVDATGDSGFLAEALPLVETEYNMWMAPDGHHLITVALPGKKSHNLNFYGVPPQDGPRPESYWEDLEMSKRSKSKSFFTEVVAGAQTGWDYSSRWFKDQRDMDTIQTTSVVPVDLNAILYRVEDLLEQWCNRLGLNNLAAVYGEAKSARAAAMEDVLWSEALQQWVDYDLWSKSQSSIISASNFVPMWSLPLSAERSAAVVDSLQRSGLLLPGGVATTLVETEQQWDLPNSWSPLLWFLVDGLWGLNTSSATALGDKLARQWVEANLIAFQHTEHMHEKLDATVLGKVGGGGEYVQQVGFGWTNGCVLDLIHRLDWSSA